MQISNPANAKNLKAAVLDLGFHTHAVSLDSKYVGLKTTYDPKTGKMTVTARTSLILLSACQKLRESLAPNAYIYPKGPAWIYVIADGVPSKGSKIMIGDGAAPPTR